MKVAIGFYGFIRTKITRDNVSNFMKLFPSDTTFDIYINCPNKLKEFDEEQFNIIEMKKELYEIFNFPNTNIGKINLYQYDPFVYINKSQILQFPYYIDSKVYFCCPFRILSLHYGISNICKLISIQNINYDLIIEKFYLIENKNNIDFCNIIQDCLKYNIFNTNTNILNEVISCYQDIFNNIYKYYIIGYFFESYLDKYNKIISKIKLINDESSSLIDENNYFKNKKDQIYILLIKDFLLELLSNFFLNIFKIYDIPLNINSNNNSSIKLFEKITNNLDNLIDIYNLHNNNIDEILS